MHLIEENIESKMFELFNTKPNWLDVYKDLRQICNAEKDSDIADSLNARFIYNLIKNKEDLEQFSQVMAYMYENNKQWDLGVQLNDFFYRRDVGIDLNDYVKLDKYNNDESFYDNMAYLFLDFDKKKPRGKQLLLDKENLPYLLAMANEITEENLKVFQVAGYNRFIGYFACNPEEIKPLIEMAQNNKAFSKFEVGEYSNFFGNLLKDIGSNSYEPEVYPNQSKSIYKALKKSIKDVDAVIAEALFRQTRSNQLEKVGMDSGLLNFCLLIEPEIDIISKINEKYQQLLSEVKSPKKGDNYKSLNEKDKVIRAFYAPISTSFPEHNFKLDCSKIDISKDFRENYIYLKLMEIKIRNKQDLEISKEVCQYVVKLYDEKSKKDDDDIMTSLFDIDTYLKKGTILPYVKKYMQYKELDGSLEKNEESKKKKMKV
jgi:hypothetical protein